MGVTDFNNNFLNNILIKINQEQKKFFLVEFNVDLMYCNEHKPTNYFLYLLVFNSYLLYIINLVDMQVIQEPLLTKLSVMSSQKTFLW